jgi:hypothetical protein
MTLAGALIVLIVGVVLWALLAWPLTIIGIVLTVAGAIGVVLALVGHGAHGPRV